MAFNATSIFSRLGLAAAAFVSAVALDVGTKWLVVNVVMMPPRLIEITPFFNLTLGFNTGVSFGMFQAAFTERPLLLLLAQGINAAGFLAWALRAEGPPNRISLGLIAGGAIGNVIDRAQQGAVTDFIDLHFAGWHWPAFNLADSAIALGVSVFLVGALLPARSIENLGARQD